MSASSGSPTGHPPYDPSSVALGLPGSDSTITRLTSLAAALRALAFVVETPTSSPSAS